jgi:hypothetical protein
MPSRAGVDAVRGHYDRRQSSRGRGGTDQNRMERLTDPNVALATLVVQPAEALPGFSTYVGSNENLFCADSICGVFSACSTFVRERTIPSESWLALAMIINAAVVDASTPLSEAACTCFLENLADFRHPLRAFPGRRRTQILEAVGGGWLTRRCSRRACRSPAAPSGARS